MSSTAIEALVSTVERAQQRSLSLMREQERAQGTAQDRARPAEPERPATSSIGLDWRHWITRESPRESIRGH